MQSWVYRQGEARGFARAFAKAFSRSFSKTEAGATAEVVAAETARALLRALLEQGIVVPDEARKRLLASKDPSEVDRWVDHTIRPGIVEAP